MNFVVVIMNITTQEHDATDNWASFLWHVDDSQRNGVGVSSEPLRLLLLALSLLHPTAAVCNRRWHADGRSIHTDVRRNLLQPLYRRRGIS